MLAVTFFEATNSVFNITNENNRFSISTPGFWSPKGIEETMNRLHIILNLKSKKHFELNVKEMAKRGTRIKKDNNGYKFADFDHFKSEILAKIKRRKIKSFEDMVYIMQLTYKEIVYKKMTFSVLKDQLSGMSYQ